MRSFLIAAFLLITGCATKSTLAPINYRFVDNVEKQQIELTYRNESKRTLCLSPEQWPNSAGKIDQGSDYVFLLVGDRRFPVEDFNTGYCPKCSTAVAPNQEITSFISYKDFNLPSDLANKPKQLEFHPKAFECAKKASAPLDRGSSHKME